MRRTFCGVLAVGVLLASQAGADEAAKAVIDKAITAHGGADNLTKYKAARWKGKGKFYGFGEALDYSGEWFQQLPTQTKVVIDVDVSGMKIVNARVVSGDKAWANQMGIVNELGKDELAEAHEALHYDRVVSLVPLKGVDYQLTSLGESKVQNKSAVGVKVSRKGRRDIQLYFDKDSGLLVKGAMKVKDPMTGNQELDQEMFYSGHKEVQGRKVPMKAVIHRQGKLYIDAEISQYERLDRLDDKEFVKPQE